MIGRQLLAVLCAVTLISGDVGAVVQSDIDLAISQIQSDSTKLSGWLADQFRHIVPFNSTMGQVVPRSLKLFGVEVGVEAAVSGTEIDVDALRALNTSVVDLTDVDTEDRFPFPAVIGHAKVGLPFGLDAGIRVGGIPEKEVKENDSSIKVKNKIIGVDVRKKVIEEGVTRPFGLTVGLSYTHAEGEVRATEPYDSNLGTTVVGTANYATTLNAVGTNVMAWDTNSWGLQAILNKKIAFINPYIGASANRNFGSVTNTLTTAGSLTLTNVANSADTQTLGTLNTSGSASRAANKWDIRALLGAEFSILPFLMFGIHGEYAGSKNIAGAVGLRAQFR